MIGLGPGARSYTRALHYSSEYAVGQPGVRSIIENFNKRELAGYAYADYGVMLNDTEQKLRYIIKSLLRADGVSHASYHRRFGIHTIDDVPQLNELLELGLATGNDDCLRLNEEGLAWSDTIGPWLYSDTMAARMSEYEFV